MDGSRGPVELSHLLGVTSAASSGVVDRLAARGHVQRRPHPDDGRRTQVEVTETGRQEIDAMLQPLQARLIEVDAAFDDDERAVVRRYLQGVTEALRSRAVRRPSQHRLATPLIVATSASVTDRP